MTNNIKKVCVFASSSTKLDEIYYNDARELGRLIAEEGYELPYFIEDWHDIADILFKPLFPIGFYTGAFDNNAEDVISLTLVNAMCGKGTTNYG